MGVVIFSEMEKVEIKKFSLEDKVIYAINVPKSNKLHSYRGRVFIRVGASNKPLSVHEIIEKAAESLFFYFDTNISIALKFFFSK